LIYKRLQERVQYFFDISSEPLGKHVEHLDNSKAYRTIHFCLNIEFSLMYLALLKYTVQYCPGVVCIRWA
jgi:hypothetical protein